ncbi:RipA family octameric membrane protein [Roseibium polysiphoniae]|uniref:Uncharacterized protein n=1 Tax=Roseibium polysiphoniae TaxID=2571221 RepID=A0ABR9C740_9HYPH|nr:hypothetical protein [Roseibium polysiphoniae]MBD8875413.1 hypothetical protein [Roseibium polysiphoniae]
MSPGEPEQSSQDQGVLEIYKMLVEMADRVSQRRQSANSFYLTVNTAIVGGAAYLSKSGYWGTFAVSAAGIAICFLWVRAVVSYKSLNAAKFRVITALEERLPVSPYKDEWAILDVDGDGKKHTPFHKTEVLVPIVFGLLHVAQVLIQIPLQCIGSLI